MGLLIPILVALLAVLALLAGVFDRPPFEYHDSIEPHGTDLMTLVVASKDRDIGGHVKATILSLEKAILATSEGPGLLDAAADAYGVPDGRLSVGLFFDDPKITSEPRWAAGWPIQANLEQAHALAQQVSETTGESVKAVRIPNQARLLKASIPWRFMLTPMIAPMMHWPRGMEKYKQDNEQEAGLALEVYVKGKNGSYKTIDYIVYPDATIPLRDAFDETEAVMPGAEAVQEERIEQEVAVPVEEQAPDAAEEVPADAEPEQHASEPETVEEEQQVEEQVPLEEEQHHTEGTPVEPGHDEAEGEEELEEEAHEETQEEEEEEEEVEPEENDEHEEEYDEADDEEPGHEEEEEAEEEL